MQEREPRERGVVARRGVLAAGLYAVRANGPSAPTAVSTPLVTEPRRGDEPGPARHAEVAALPLAAALVLEVARWLPVEFHFRPNALGIVSRATLAEYPLQQEMFWLLYAAGFGLVAALGIGALLRRREWSPGRGIALEALAVSVLAVLLFLPRAFAPLALALVAGIAVLARSASARAAHAQDPAGARSCEPPPRRSMAWRAAWLALLVVIALGMSATLPVQLERVLAGTPDALVTADNWGFHAEIGQHLACADALLDGRMQGRDFFSLYGPYLDLVLVGLWQVFGRSISAANLYAAGMFVGGGLAVLFAGWVSCRRKWVALALVPLAPPISLRYGMGLFALTPLAAWIRGGARAWCGAAGLIGGLALLYSQEFGLAFLLTAALAFLVRGDGRALAWFAAGLSVAVTPLLVWYASKDALGELLANMAAYPSWVAAGYAKHPFPALLPALPLELGSGDGADALTLRMAYLLPAACVGALALCAGVARIELGRPWRFPLELRRAWRAAPEVLLVALLAFFGFVSFRSALGRSDALHIAGVVGAPTLLLVLALDRTLPFLLTPGRRALGAWRILLVYALAWFGALPQSAASFGTLGATARDAWRVVAGTLEPPRGSPRVNEVAEWIRSHTSPEDRVSFVPSAAGYLYLTDRREPSRFLLTSQMVTDAHRAEALAAMQATPPRYVVFDPHALRVDGIPDRIVLGPDLSDWIASRYELETTIRGVEIHRRKADGGARTPPGERTPEPDPAPK